MSTVGVDDDEVRAVLLATRVPEDREFAEPAALVAAEVDGVRLESPKSLRKGAAATAALNADDIERLARILVTALPSK